MLKPCGGSRCADSALRGLLGLNGARKRKTLAVSPRLGRRMRQIEALAPKPKQQLLGLIDTFIAAAEQPRHGAKL